MATKQQVRDMVKSSIEQKLYELSMNGVSWDKVRFDETILQVGKCKLVVTADNESFEVIISKPRKKL